MPNMLAIFVSMLLPPRPKLSLARPLRPEPKHPVNDVLTVQFVPLLLDVNADVAVSLVDVLTAVGNAAVLAPGVLLPR